YLWWVAAPVLMLAVSGSQIAAKTLNAAPNASFEQGAGAPDGWTLGAGASWAASARTGSRSLGAETARPQRAGTSGLIPVDPEQSYRLDGWIHCEKGRARLGMDVLDGAGKVIDTAATPWVTPGSTWQFTAVERDLAGRASKGVRLWLEVDGRAQLD